MGLQPTKQGSRQHTTAQHSAAIGPHRHPSFALPYLTPDLAHLWVGVAQQQLHAALLQVLVQLLNHVRPHGVDMAHRGEVQHQVAQTIDAVLAGVGSRVALVVFQGVLWGGGEGWITGREGGGGEASV